jgi:NADH-dependent peroxiredoxin subunit F
MSFSFNFNPTINTPSLDESVLYDHLVIGGGPAGYNAALYAFRKGLSTAIIAKRLGGQLLNTSSVDNYLGIAQISGEGLNEAFINHLKQFEVPMLEDVSITKIEKSGSLFKVHLDNKQTLKAKTILLSSGSNPRRLDIPGEATFSDKGVAYCAICDAPLFKDKVVIIAGGGNSAVEASLDVAKWASKVIVVHRSEFRADKILVDQMLNHEKITVFKQTQILEIFGDTRMKGIRVLDKSSSQQRDIEADGLFVEIGNIPSSDLVKDLVSLSETGHVLVDPHQRTSLPGLYAAGDVCESPYKQIIIAVAQGATAALAASEYINQLGGNYAFNE